MRERDVIDQFWEKSSRGDDITVSKKAFFIIMEKNSIKKDEIVEAASRLFSKKGYKATSLKEIAGMVGLHKTSLFHYFKNKEAVLMEVMDRSLDNYINVLDYPPIDPKMPAEDKLRVALERQIGVLCTYKDYINVYLSEIKNLSPKNRAKYDQKRREYGRNFEKIVQEIKADERSGLFNSHDPKVVTFAILGMCNWMLNWYKKNGALQPKEIVQIFFSLISGNRGK